MIIQFNANNLINWDEPRELHFKTAIEDRLWPNCSHIAKIEVHLSDESLEKEAFRNIRCLIEVYLKGHQRISATIRSAQKSWPLQVRETN
jgi:hypothetical protein